MVLNKSLDFPLRIITALLMDVQTLHSEVFTLQALRLTLKKVSSRCSTEGVSFLTKALPRLGKALDKALAEAEPLNATELGFEAQPGCQYPRFLGELFSQVLSHNGAVLPDADVRSVISLRQLLYCFYKYELPYDTKTEQGVLQKFERTEEDVDGWSKRFGCISEALDVNNDARGYLAIKPEWTAEVICRARKLLFKLFDGFDQLAIIPRHGPGAVSEKIPAPYAKYDWGSIPARVRELYPVDAYFFTSMTHVADRMDILNAIPDEEAYARVCLVPKDSRGPRIISCEPTALQWLQQGLRDTIYRLVESHPLTCDEVRFTDQQPNRMGALIGSRTGRYATLDLNEASDRVSVGLVRLLFPGQVLPALMACRSLGTQLPNGRKLLLHKYAPMGSALCFPVLALTVWALLKAGLLTRDADSQPTIFVYGDDVIVDTENSEHAMNILEAFGLKVNRDKSCTSGFFRESCGMDAYKGVCVTPVRFKTVWSDHHCPSAYVSWIEYANRLWNFQVESTPSADWHRSYRHCYNEIVDRLVPIYGHIPEKACGLSAPSLESMTSMCRKPRSRVNRDLQRSQKLVWDVVPMSITHNMDSWNMLLRYCVESGAASKYERQQTNASSEAGSPRPQSLSQALCDLEADEFSASEYTLRKRNKLRLCWR